jgi:hypothetical protein
MIQHMEVAAQLNGQELYNKTTQLQVDNNMHNLKQLCESQYKDMTKTEQHITWTTMQHMANSNGDPLNMSLESATNALELCIKYNEYPIPTDNRTIDKDDTDIHLHTQQPKENPINTSECKPSTYATNDTSNAQQMPATHDALDASSTEQHRVTQRMQLDQTQMPQLSARHCQAPVQPENRDTVRHCPTDSRGSRNARHCLAPKAGEMLRRRQK